MKPLALPPTLGLLLALLPPLSSCSETNGIRRSSATVVAVAATSASLSTQTEFAPTSLVAGADAIRNGDSTGAKTELASADRIVGTYDIVTEATRKHAGFLGHFIAAKVQGSSLELRADRTYVGTKNGEPESAGRWSFADGELQMTQTHEGSEPVAGQGRGTLRADTLTVQTEKSGLSITLIFARR